MKEGDYYEVDLTTSPGRREVTPYAYSVIYGQELWIDQARLGGRAAAEPDSARIKRLIEEHVFDTSHPDNVARLAAIIDWIRFNPGNPARLNPFSPQAEALRPQFLEQFSDDVSQGIAVELWEYEQREAIRNMLERAAGDNGVYIEIIGQLASGKTTFLNTIVRELSLGEANLGIIREEPEDVLAYYPDLETQYDIVYARGGTRGVAATLGSEELRLFGFSQAENRNQLVRVDLHSAGGHLQADKKARKDYAASAFFLDYSLMQELAGLSLETDLSARLSNQETVSETVLSIIARLHDWREVTGARLGVITKLPFGLELSDDILDFVDRAYANVLAYAREHYDELNTTAMFSGFKLALPADSGVKDSTDEWLPIYEDHPVCTGSLDVLKRLVDLSRGRRSNGPNTGIQLVTLGKEAGPNRIHYVDALEKSRDEDVSV